MRTLAAVNQKGGSGKTTTSVNLASTLAEKKRKVLVIDLDPQANATTWLGAQPEGLGILQLAVNTDITAIASNANIPGVSVIAASDHLINADAALAQTSAPALLLRQAIAKIPAKSWDYIILDCPPTLGILTLNALAAASEVLITVEAHAMALNGVAKLVETIGKVKGGPNPDLAICGVLACRVNRTRHAQQIVERLRAFFGAQVFKTVIRENVKLAEASSFREPITIFDPASNGAEDYRALAAEIIKQEKKKP